MNPNKNSASEAKNPAIPTMDAMYYARIARIIADLARSPYDVSFYFIVRDICGEKEDGECWLGTEKLAYLCKMSAGKVDDCRKYWMKLGFITGKKVRHEEIYLWHLQIVDIWDRNNVWVEKHPTIASRVEYAKSRKDEHKRGIAKKENTCARCKDTFTVTGKRQLYCPPCAAERHKEKTLAGKKIRMRKDEYIQSSPCEKCGGQEHLELHLDDLREAPGVICRACHDELHYTTYPMNVEDLGCVHSSHDSTRSSDKLSWANPSIDERKKSRFTKEQLSPKVDSSLKGADLWNEAVPLMKKRFSAKDFAKYIEPSRSGSVNLSQHGNVLQIIASKQPDFYDFWSLSTKQEIMLAALREFDPNIKLQIWDTCL